MTAWLGFVVLVILCDPIFVFLVIRPYQCYFLFISILERCGDYIPFFEYGHLVLLVRIPSDTSLYLTPLVHHLGYLIYISLPTVSSVRGGFTP